MTKEYIKLKKRIEEIKENFSFFIEPYPKEINNKNQDLIKSFILLCHTELENYFENICIRIISNSKATYDKNQKLFPSLLSLSLMSDRNFNDNEQDFTTPKSRLNKLYTNYFATINNNNGIKEKDLRKLLPIIGIEMTTIDDTLLSQLNAFGTKRGQTAHTTKKQIRRFKEEVETVDNLIVALEELDKIFENTK